MNLAEVDVLALDNFVNGFPHEMFRVLRREAPVYWHREQNGSGFWALTRYADVITVSKDNVLFSSARGGTNVFDVSAEQLAQSQMIMLNMDPPRHTKYRRLVSQAFTPRMIAGLEERVRAVACAVVDKVAGKGECDFVTEVAAELPLQVIVEMLGVPVADRHLMFDWSNRLIGFDDPEYQTSPDDGAVAAAELWGYANQLAAERRAQPRDDLVTALVDATVDGERLSEMEFDSFFLLLVVAGNETTRNLISGGMQALLEHRDQWERLRAEPALLPTAVEEMLRWVSPVIHFRRTATRDTQIRGQHICAGDKVAVFYGSANRDEGIFRNPDRFDVGRRPNEHLAFGIGEHFCLGATLARLEIRVMFEELLRRLPDIELAGPVRRLRSNFINGIKSMPVRFTPSYV